MKQLLNHPQSDILDRDLAIAEAKPIIDKWSPYLIDLCNFGTNLLCRCDKSRDAIDGTPESLLHLYYHILQMADAAQVLCSKCCFTATIPLLRSMWEANISIDYMVKTDFESSSTAWMACCYRDLKSQLERFDLSTEKGKEFYRLTKDEPHRHILEKFVRNSDYVRKAIKALSDKLGQSKYASVLARTQGKYKKWFSINGKTDLPRLAADLGRRIEYEVLFRRDSTMLHAVDANNMILAQDGFRYIQRIRDCSNGEKVYMRVQSILVNSTVLVASMLRADENVRLKLREMSIHHNIQLNS